MIFWSLGQCIETDISLRLPRFHTPVASSLSIREATDSAARAQRATHDYHAMLDDTVQRARIAVYQTQDGHHGLAFQHHDAGLSFFYDPRTPSDIHYTATTSFDEADIASVIEGPLLGWWLREQGHALLHASSITWHEKQLAITATPGVGKSTLAALFCGHGARLWSDDILCYDPSTGLAYADGRPQRLSVAAKQLRDETAVETTRVHSQTDKIFATTVRPVNDALTVARKIDHVMVLVDRVSSPTPQLTSLQGPAAVAAILHGRYPSWLRTSNHQQKAFAAAAQLVRHVPLTLAHMPDSLTALENAGPFLMDWLQDTLGVTTSAP